MPARQQGSSRSGRVYEALLVAYPKEFRREYGPHMAQAFRDLYREKRSDGAWGVLRLWARTLLDLAATAFAERSKTTRGSLLALGGRILTLRRFMLFNAIILLVFGFVFANAGPVEVYGVPAPDWSSQNPKEWAAISFGRFLGVACVGFGALLWATSRVADLEPRPPVAGTLFAVNLLGSFWLLGVQLSMWETVAGWVTVGVHVFLALGYGYFVVAKARVPSPSSPATR